MRRLFGLLLAAMGIAFAHTAYQNAPSHREDQLAEVTRILTNPGVDVAVQSPAAAKPANTVPSAALAKPSAPSVAPAAVAKTAEASAAPTTTATAAPESATVAAAPVAPTSAWQTSVKASAQRVGSTAAVASAAPGDSSARYELVRALQKELKRVGCYKGEANGSWGISSRRGLTAFMDRVNATLPVDKPDYIQLTLLQNQKAAVCGAQCPKGQSSAENGRCVPSAILARGKSVKPDDGTAADAQTAAIAAEQLPWANGNRGASVATQTYETASIELPAATKPNFAGRMSVGAPVPPAGAKVSPTPALTSGSKTALLDDPAFPADRAAGNNLKVAALAPSDLQGGESLPATDQARIVVPKGYYAPKYSKVATRPAPRQRVRYSFRQQRSVQSLFTHPLGRM